MVAFPLFPCCVDAAASSVCVSFVLQVLMLTVATFASEDAFISVYLSAAIVMTSLVLHMYLWPYAERLLNWLTAMVLGCVLGTQYLSLLYWYAPQWSVPITAALLLLNGATALLLVAALFRASLPKEKLCRLLRRGRRRRRLQALRDGRPPPVGASEVIMLAHASGNGRGKGGTSLAGGLAKQPLQSVSTAWTDNPLGAAAQGSHNTSTGGQQQEDWAAAR